MSVGLPSEDLSILWQDGERVLRRESRLGADGTRTVVLVVAPAAEHPAPAVLERLAHEYGLKEELEPAWAVRPRELVRERGTTLLVLEDPGGEPLEGVVGAPMEMGSFLRLAIGIAAALGKLHQRSLVHKDVKPANILVNHETSETRLTGFGLASRLPRERQAPEPPEFIAGTLAYMAPEQSGRMNRSIDSRSDLYALGVTLYQMLTGSLPFTATDPMEWVHCHIARKPVPPSKRLENVPAPVSAIIMRLLAKTAEDRYQTAGGVERDLRRCLAQWDAEGRIDDFPLGENDMPDRLLVPEKLYGRSREVETLLTAFDRVVTGGKPELLLVSGYSGIGKSSVVNELHKLLVPPRGLFASGKFDQYKRDIPYATLAQAFQSLVRYLLGRNDAELTGWRDALAQALGPNGPLMIDLVPELELIIGEQPPLPELAPQDARRRFQVVFRRFIGVFAQRDHPLALFLDDLQWLDAATLDLLEDLLTGSDLQHLMLIGAYRTNEVTSAHPLRQKLEAIGTAGGKVVEITLAPLAPEHLQQLISGALRCEAERAAPLAQLVHEKTGGNPFFANRFIASLAEEGMLIFDHDAARWSWDLGRIQAKGYTDNLVDLMAGKLTRLSAETQKAVQQLACLGHGAAVATLSLVSGTTETETHSRLEGAVRADLLERRKDSYHFIHDRIQEAAYLLVPDSVRAAAHLRIGRLLVANTPPDQQGQAIYEIVNQLNRGALLIASDQEREQLAELNLIAGKRAKASTAYASALNYLVMGEALLPGDCWDRKYLLVFAMDVARAECEFLTGDLAAAEERLSTLSVRAANLVDKAAVACLRTALYTTLARADRAVEICLEYLREGGVACSPQPTDEEISAEYERLLGQLDGRSIEALFDLPLMSDPDWRATMEVLTELSAPAYFVDANLWRLVVLRMANLSAEHGNCDGSCYAYGFMNMVVGARFGNYRAGARFGQLSLDLVEKKGLDRFKARVYCACALSVVPWTQHIRAGVPLLRRSVETALETGDQQYAAYAQNALVLNRLASADPLAEVQCEADSALEFGQKARFGLGVDVLAGHLGFIRTVRGLTPEFGSFCDDGFDEGSFEQHLEASPAFVGCWYWIRKLQARLYAGDYAQAVAAAAKARPLLQATSGLFEEADYHFYAALARAAASDSGTPDEQREQAGALAEHHQRLALRAEHCPENFADRAALVGAEMARLEGRELEAEHLYEQAIRSAREQGFVQNEALAYELAAQFHAARGFEAFADLYLRNARDCYRQWGADGKVRQLDALYPRLRDGESVQDSRGTVAASVEQLELATVLKVSQAIAGEIVLEKLLDTLMRIALEEAGAERGLLIIPRGTETYVQAEATTSGEAVIVRLEEAIAGRAAVPESVLSYVMRTGEPVVLDDASTHPLFSGDAYLRDKQARSVLCLPLLRQGKVTGVLYLENNLARRVFTPGRIAVLRVLASQAAMSLENTRLYRDLEKREAKIRRLVDADIIGIYIWDFDGRILEANDAFLHVIGYDRDDLAAGRIRWADLTPPDWRERIAERIREHERAGRLGPWEREFFRKDGSRVPVLIGVASFEEKGTQGVAFVLDLTERKRAEGRVLAQHRATRILAEALTVEEARPRILQALCECLGWHLGAWWRLEREASVLRCAALWRPPSVEAPQFEAATLAISFPLGSGLPGRAWASRAPLCIADVAHDPTFLRAGVAAREGLHAAFAFPILLGGEVLGVIDLVSREIRQPDQDLLDLMATLGSQIGQFIERKRAEQALRESERESRLIVNTIPGLVLVLTPAGEIDVVNDQLSEYCGQPLEALRQWRMNETVHSEDLPRVVEVITQGMASGEAYGFEARIRRFDGIYRWFQVRHLPLRDTQGQVARWYALLSDIDDRKRAEAELREAYSELTHVARVTTMGELTASIAHEVRQPIAAAVTSAQTALRWLEAQPPELGEVREALSRIVRAGKRAGDVIGRIRALVTKAPPRKDSVEINSAIREVVELTRGEAVKNGVSVRTDLAEGLLLIQGDRVQLQQVILNLIINGIEAMTGVGEASRVLLISSRKGDAEGVVVAVADTGPGLAAGAPEQLFAAFYTTKPSGLGLGLSICRSIIEAHDGRLWASANVPHGAVFQFTLPAPGTVTRRDSRRSGRCVAPAASVTHEVVPRRELSQIACERGDAAPRKLNACNTPG